MGCGTSLEKISVLDDRPLKDNTQDIQNSPKSSVTFAKKTESEKISGHRESIKHKSSEQTTEEDSDLGRLLPRAHLSKGDNSFSENTSSKMAAIQAYNDDCYKLAQQTINANPEHAESFVEMNEFVEIVYDDPEMKKHKNRIVELTSKILQRSYVNLSASFRRAYADYMSYVKASEAIFKLYTAFMRSHSLDFLTQSVAASQLTEAELQFINNLRVSVWNYTDSSVQFAERICNSGLLKYFVADLKAIWDETQDANKISPRDRIFRAARGILHNCAQNPVTRVTIRELGTVQVALNYLTVKPENQDKIHIIQTTILLLLATIVDEEDNKLLLADENVFTIILKMIQYAWLKPQHRCDGFSVVELTTGLTDLAKNDQNKQILTKKGALPVLMTIVVEGSQEEQVKAVECIWELAFDKENQKAFQNNKTLMKGLNQLKTSPNKKLAKVVAGALWVIEQEKEAVKEVTESPREQTKGKQPRGHVMISYQWADQKIMIRIKELLRSHGYSVWMDIDNMGGSTLQAMAEAVQNSAVVLVCMSERYKESLNCRSEAEYAFDIRKPIVPLLMQGGYKPDGWLGFIKGSKLFFDFSGKYGFDKKAAELLKELGDRGKSRDGIDTIDAVSSPVLKAPPPDAGRGSVNVVNWSGNDVSNWLSKLDLKKHSTLKNITGKQLGFLRKLSYKAPEFFYNYLKTDLRLDKLEELMNFSEAVEAL